MSNRTSPVLGLTVVDRAILLVLGLALGVGGMGLTASFGLLSFIGMPMLVVGLGCISGATGPSR